MLKGLKISSRQYEDQEPIENASINKVQFGDQSVYCEFLTLSYK